MTKHILLLAAVLGFIAQSSVFAADPTPSPSPSPSKPKATHHHKHHKKSAAPAPSASPSATPKPPKALRLQIRITGLMARCSRKTFSDLILRGFKPNQDPSDDKARFGPGGNARAESFAGHHRARFPEKSRIVGGLSPSKSSGTGLVVRYLPSLAGGCLGCLRRSRIRRRVRISVHRAMDHLVALPIPNIIIVPTTIDGITTRRLIVRRLDVHFATRIGSKGMGFRIHKR